MNMRAIYKLILIAICYYFGSITVYAETNDETRISNYLEELLLDKAPSINVSKITHVVNRHYGVKPKRTIETDTLSNDYYLRINNNNSIHTLCLDYGDSLYLLGLKDVNSLFSALSKANSIKWNNSIEFFIENSIRESDDSIIEANNIYFFEDSIFIKNSSNKRTLYDLISNFDCKRETLPIDDINDILNVNSDKDYSIAEYISKMKLNIRPELDSIFQIYKVELPPIINNNNLDNCFILIISYKGNFFVCPSWDYNTWACILYYIKSFDRNKCDDILPLNDDDFCSILKSIDAVCGTQWIEFKQLRIAPNLYKTLMIYSEQ